MTTTLQTDSISSPATMTTAKALHDLGVREDTLTPAMIQQMDELGYLLVPNVLSRQTCDAMRVRLDELAAIEGEKAGLDFHTEVGSTRLGSLVNKDPMFDICFLHPLALAAVYHIHKGREWGISSVTSRTASPGQGLQGLHTDFQCPSEICSANALWLIDDFTPENGPTRLIPGSHNPRRVISVEGKPDWKPTDPHPDQITILAPAGTLVVIDSFTWHGGTTNRTQADRHLISAYCAERGHYQGFAYRKVGAAAQKRLSPAALYMLDHEPV